MICQRIRRFPPYTFSRKLSVADIPVLLSWRLHCCIIHLHLLYNNITITLLIDFYAPSYQFRLWYCFVLVFHKILKFLKKNSPNYIHCSRYITSRSINSVRARREIVHTTWSKHAILVWRTSKYRPTFGSLRDCLALSRASSKTGSYRSNHVESLLSTSLFRRLNPARDYKYYTYFTFTDWRLPMD